MGPGSFPLPASIIMRYTLLRACSASAAVYLQDRDDFRMDKPFLASPMFMDVRPNQ